MKLSLPVIYMKNIIFLGPINCKCGSYNIAIYKDSTYHTSGCSFRCNNNLCRRRYPIRINSLFEKFSYIRLEIIAEIINCFISLDINAKKAQQYLLNEKNIKISNRSINKIYKELRNIICEYLLIVYESEPLSEKKENSYFEIDESLFGHRDGKPIWIIGAINTQNKSFRLEGVNERNAVIIKHFISKYIETGNNIITDG